MDRRHLPEDWDIKTLSKISKIVNGYSFKSENFLPENLIKSVKITNVGVGEFIQDSSSLLPKDFLDKYKNFRVSKNDIVIALTRSIISNGLKIAIVPDEYNGALLNQRVAAIKSDSHSILGKFLFFYLSTPNVALYVKKEANTLMQPNLSIKSLSNLLIPVPPINEQKRIVATLDEAFEGIDQAIRNTEKNLANARELFDSYLNKIFIQKGDGWDKKRLADIAEVQSGGTPSRSKSNYWSGEIAWYSSGELNDLYTNKPERTITDEGLVNSNAKLFPKGSLLVGMYDTAALKMSILDREATFNQAIAGVKPNKKIDLVFILHAINFVKPEILSLRRGVRQKNLSLQKIKDISITIPDLEEQKKVVLQLASIKKETQRLETIYRQKIAALNELKQSILQKAFTGQLT